MHISLPKLILPAAALLLLSVGACSSTSTEKRRPASDSVAKTDAESYFPPAAPISYPNGVSAPQLVTDTSAHRRVRRQNYQQQENSWFGSTFQASSRSSGGGGGCRGPAYSHLVATISHCGCQIVNACGQDHRAPMANGLGDSCHNYGKAVDVMAIRCGGDVLKAEGNSKRFNQFVACERDFFKKTLWHNDRTHYNNAHFSFCCPESPVRGLC